MTNTNSAMAYKTNSFGKALPIEETKKDREEYANVFSEGSETLKELLLYLWGKDIATTACCTGHICKPLFKKKFLWTEIYVSEKEYLENQHKKGYRYVLTDTTGYLAFKYSYENMYHAAHTLREMINAKSPVPAMVAWSEDSINIYMEYPVNSMVADEFFKTVMDVFPAWENGLR